MQRIRNSVCIEFWLREWIVHDELRPQYGASVTEADGLDFVLLK